MQDDSVATGASGRGERAPSYVLIQSRDPFDGGDIGRLYDVARLLVSIRSQVTVLLLQEGVRAAAGGGHTFWFAALRRAGVEILADGPSLGVRGIAPRQLRPGVGVTDAGASLEGLLEGRRALWITDRSVSRAA